jgi:hypothetical protein
MTMSDLTHYETRTPVNFLALLFGAAAAPIAWLGQIMLNYSITAYACYPGDHPVTIASASALKAAMLAFDAMAILVTVVGGIVAWLSLMKARVHMREGQPHPAAEGRALFIAIWGIFSSLWFLGAILFTTIASLTVPPCLN